MCCSVKGVRRQGGREVNKGLEGQAGDVEGLVAGPIGPAFRVQFK